MHLTPNHSGADGRGTGAGDAHAPAAGAEAASGAALVDVLEAGAGALLMLEGLRARVERLGGGSGAQEAIRAATEMIRSALEDLDRHADDGFPAQLALGFVTGRERRLTGPQGPAVAG